MNSFRGWLWAVSQCVSVSVCLSVCVCVCVSLCVCTTQSRAVRFELCAAPNNSLWKENRTSYQNVVMTIGARRPSWASQCALNVCRAKTFLTVAGKIRRSFLLFSENLLLLFNGSEWEEERELAALRGSQFKFC